MVFAAGGLVALVVLHPKEGLPLFASGENVAASQESALPAIATKRPADWQMAAWEMAFASRELPGCTCYGEWEVFRQVLNWTLAHSPTGSGPFGTVAASAKLCASRGAPLVHASAGGDLMAATRDIDIFAAHPCAAGLVTALALCASAHSELAAADLTVHGLHRENFSQDQLPSRNSEFNWQHALRSWPTRFTADCSLHHRCLAHLEALLTAVVLHYCGHCLEKSLWPISAEEINENSVSFLYSLFTGTVQTPPPPWKGPAAALRVRQLTRVAGAGAFTATGIRVAVDAIGAASLIDGVAALWSRSIDMPMQDASYEGQQSDLPLGRRHFNRIFGSLHRLGDIGARGPLGTHMEVHADDFSGPRAGLRFYIYDLPGVAHADMLAALHGRIRESVPRPSNCDFGMSPCAELETGGGAFSGYRPYAAEVTFLAKLLASPERIFVDDPEKATFFVVPFFSSTWCFLAAPKCWVRCGGLRPLNSLFALLPYFNASTAHRHLFLASDSTGDLPLDLQMQLLTFSYGPNPCEHGSGPLIGPPPVTDDLPSLGAADFATKDVFLFTADGVGIRPFRKEAIVELEKWQRRFPHIFVVARRGEYDAGNSPPPAFWAHEMRRAIFCPVLPGDNTFRMRLFHAVLAGCIPVVVLFPGGSWYRLFGPSLERSLPFASKIDWHSLAVEIPHDPRAENFSKWATRLVPSLVAKDAAAIQARQKRLAIAASYLRYDFRGQQPDAFTLLLDELVLRAAAPVPTFWECFDPRERHNTARSISGTIELEREEREVFGILACCPQRFRSRRTAGAGPSERACAVRVAGRCVQLVLPQDETSEHRHFVQAYIEAVFAGRRFEEEGTEDNVCIR